MHKDELLHHVRQLPEREKLELIQFLAEELKQTRRISVPPPPPPKAGTGQVPVRDEKFAAAEASAAALAGASADMGASAVFEAFTVTGISVSAGASVPAGASASPLRLELAAAPGQPPLGRMSAESTMQLSVNDLIDVDDEEDVALLASLTKGHEIQTVLQSSHQDNGKGSDKSIDKDSHKTMDIIDVNDGTKASVAEATIEMGENPSVEDFGLVSQDEHFPDEDRVFESLMAELSDDEMQLLETLGTVRRLFWAPLQQGFKALDVSDVQRALQTMEFAPMRIAIGELVTTSIIALVQKYHDVLHQHLEAEGIEASVHKDLFVTKKNQDQLVLALRTPFRDYIERLERLDQARDALLESLKDGAAWPGAVLSSPLLDEEGKQSLEQREEALGIEGAWRTLLDAISASLPHHTNESIVFAETLELFLTHLGASYSAVLQRVLELWNAHLLAPAKSALPRL